MKPPATMAPTERLAIDGVDGSGRAWAGRGCVVDVRAPLNRAQRRLAARLQRRAKGKR